MEHIWSASLRDMALTSAAGHSGCHAVPPQREQTAKRPREGAAFSSERWFATARPAGLWLDLDVVLDALHAFGALGDRHCLVDVRLSLGRTAHPDHAIFVGVDVDRGHR